MKEVKGNHKTRILRVLDIKIHFYIDENISGKKVRNLKKDF